MDSHAFGPAIRVLAAGMHLLVLALLAFAVVRAFAGGAPDAVSVLAVALLFAGIYLALARRRHTPILLAALVVCWLVLLALSRDGVWLAFPLFFVQLHLLPGRWGVVAVGVSTVAAIGAFAWHQREFGVGMVIGPVLGAAVAVATVSGYRALYRESEQRRRLIDELQTTRRDLDAAQREAGVLAERERLAREIHDTLAQGLSSIQLLLSAAERRLSTSDSAALDQIRAARTAASDNLAAARRFVRDLTPPELTGASLPAALDRLCANVSRDGVVAQLHTSGERTDLPTAHEVALLRIAQSALANVVQHARATRAELTLSYMDTEVALDVVDDGVGFDPASPPPPGPDRGFGLATMRARAAELNGTLVVESTPGGGTAVAVTLPCGGGR